MAPYDGSPTRHRAGPRNRSLEAFHHAKPARSARERPDPADRRPLEEDAGVCRPGYLVAVGYMDPGNWATDLPGGARYGYTLLSVIMISNLMAILLQSLAARLGIASGRDLAQACRDAYSRRTTFVLWVLCEIAIAACDLAEVLGAAIALQLLFGLAADLGRLPDVARRPHRALHAAPRVPLGRSDRRHAHPRHRRLLCRGAVRWRSRPWARCCAASSRTPRF